MVLFPRYHLHQTDSELTIRKSMGRQRVNLIVYLSILIAWYFGIANQKIDTGEQPLVYLFYLAHLIIFPRLIRLFKNSLREEIYSFNLVTKELTHNSKHLTTLSELNKVVIEYDKGELDECRLQLRAKGNNFLIDETDASFNEEVVHTAKRISSFLRIPVEDKHPYEEKI